MSNPNRNSKRRNTSPVEDGAGAASDDVVLLCGENKDGPGVNVLRKRGATLQAGVIRPLEEGKPLTGDVVQLSQRGNTPLFDVTVCYSPKGAETTEAPALEASPSQGRPPKVASDEYRRNWDAIWRRSNGKALLN